MATACFRPALVRVRREGRVVFDAFREGIGRDRVVIAGSLSTKGRIECFAQIYAVRAGRRGASGFPVRGYCRRTEPRIAAGAKAARLAVRRIEFSLCAPVTCGCRKLGRGR